MKSADVDVEVVVTRIVECGGTVKGLVHINAGILTNYSYLGLLRRCRTVRDRSRESKLGACRSHLLLISRPIVRPSRSARQADSERKDNRLATQPRTLKRWSQIFRISVSFLDKIPQTLHSEYLSQIDYLTDRLSVLLSDTP